MTDARARSGVADDYRQLLRDICQDRSEDSQLDAVRRRLDSVGQDPGLEAAIGAECGGLLLGVGRLDAAEEVFGALVRRFEDDPSGYAGLAQIAMRRCAWQSALELWDAMLGRFADGPRSLWQARRATVLVKLNRLDEAETNYWELSGSGDQQLLASIGLARIATRRRRWREALDRWTEVLANPGGAASPAWKSARAVVLGELGRLDEAAAVLRCLTVEFPGDPAGFVGLAQLSTRRRAWSDALEAWDAALDRFPSQSTPYWYASRAEALDELGRHKESEAALRDLLGRYPEFTLARRALVGILRRGGRHEEALAELDNGEFGDTKLLAAKIGVLISLGNLQDARAEFLRALTLPAELSLLEQLFEIMPRLFEGWRRTEMWLRLREKLASASSGDDSDWDSQRESLRLRIMLGLRDRQQFLDGVDGLKDVPDFAEHRSTLREVASRLRRSSFDCHRDSKIFCIGLSKTGTTTLSAALSQLGFRTVHWTNPLTHEIISDDDLCIFDAFADTPISVQFERLYHAFPNSKFIYTTRPIKTWTDAIARHFRRNACVANFADTVRAMHEADRFQYGAEYRRILISLYFQYQNYESAYEAYDWRVKEFFRGKPAARFLEFDLFSGQGWAELCSFVERPAPKTPFPWENRAQSHTVKPKRFVRVSALDGRVPGGGVARW